MVKKKGRSYRDELKRQRALEKVIKNCPNLEARKAALDQMDLWKKVAEGDPETLIRLGHELLGQN